MEIPAHVPMSEAIGEQLFLQGYDSNGILSFYYPETDMQLLDNYIIIAIEKECEGGDTAHGANATAEPQFALITDADIKKLKVDELLRELKARGLTTGGLKKDLKERLEKAMVDKVSVTSSISEESDPPPVFGYIFLLLNLSRMSTLYVPMKGGRSKVSPKLRFLNTDTSSGPTVGA